MNPNIVAYLAFGMRGWMTQHITMITSTNHTNGVTNHDTAKLRGNPQAEPRVHVSSS